MTSSKPITGPDLLECVGAAQIKSKVCKTGHGVGCSSPCGPQCRFLNPGQPWNDTELAAYLGVVTVGYWDNNNKHTQAVARGRPRNQCVGEGVSLCLLPWFSRTGKRTPCLRPLVTSLAGVCRLKYHPPPRATRTNGKIHQSCLNLIQANRVPFIAGSNNEL